MENDCCVAEKRKDGPSIQRVGVVFGGFTEKAAAYGVHAISLALKKRMPINYSSITFTVEDFEGITPHQDDQVVVTLRIKKFDVGRDLIDQGSSADII